MEGARAHIASNDLGVGVFRPDHQTNQQETTKHLFPGFTIRLINDPSFTDSYRIWTSIPHKTTRDIFIVTMARAR
jgi:hypothetical protein